MWCMEVVVGKIMSYYSGDRLIDVDQPITGEVSRDGVRLGHGPSATNVALGARDAMYDAVFLRLAHNAELDEALAGMSRDGLAALVRHAARTGTQITQLSITIAAMAPPPTSRGACNHPREGAHTTGGALLDGGGLDGGGVLRAYGSQESVHDDCGVVPSTTATANMCAGNVGKSSAIRIIWGGGDMCGMPRAWVPASLMWLRYGWLPWRTIAPP